MKQSQWVTLIAGCIAAVLTYLVGQIDSGQLQLPPAIAAMSPLVVFILTILSKDIRAEAATGKPIDTMLQGFLSDMTKALTDYLVAQTQLPTPKPSTASPPAPASPTSDGVPQAAPPLPPTPAPTT